ncbi:orotate phosphoribosyltransferase [Phenylobacterium sp.]|uniref:orotate phosphoribosyltransferase n=1 Tax=Phenylobacterium sp. TaxID=1871053 RepID=UPI0008C4484A|nr:orotate phosphoribosyltransferase [Phenylobacterium sp.]MBA4792507.1 orotate phosphoribosyltransferase [Phenylobacterium sp.]OHB34923.1 MAG: orotate phosphoribosyltransferase [Phenylobacterium sp. RIFCSPHIGHO2_01_FULL_70_10]
MTTDEVLEEFRGAGALREGHFVLASGRHSPIFLQKNLVFQYADRTERLCRALADRIVEQFGRPDVIVAPAVGAIIPGYEVARALGVPSIYVEREDGRFQLRRAFRIEPGAKVVVVEDVITTGGSFREAVEPIEAAGGVVLCCACIVDRSGGRAEVGWPLVALATVDFPSYAPDDVPPELAALPAEEPGSKRLKR